MFWFFVGKCILVRKYILMNKNILVIERIFYFNLFEFLVEINVKYLSELE